MSRRSLALRVACIALVVGGCGPRLANPPRAGGAQAKNANPSSEKKPKAPRPLVAPPPAYGNKIVRGQRLPVAASAPSGRFDG